MYGCSDFCDEIDDDSNHDCAAAADDDDDDDDDKTSVANIRVPACMHC